MAYASTVSAPFEMTPPPVAGGFIAGSSDTMGKMWAYKSTDPVATVRGAGYFTDGYKRGMRKGDIVFVYDTNTPNMSINWVSAATTSSTGVTLSQLTT